MFNMQRGCDTYQTVLCHIEDYKFSDLRTNLSKQFWKVEKLPRRYCALEESIFKVDIDIFLLPLFEAVEALEEPLLADEGPESID